MQNGTIEKRERVSKAKGAMMILVALVFDFAIIITLLVVFFLFFYSIANVGWVEKVGFLLLGATALGSFLLLSPLLFFLFTYINVAIAYILFFAWFFLNGINIFSLEKPKKMFVTSSSLVFEAIPILNLLPGITAMVFLNIRMARREDDEAHKAILASIEKNVRRSKNNGYPQRR